MVKKYIGKIAKRREDSHKGDYGKVFILAGSKGMTGAAYLASEGALRAGSGLVINGIPASLNSIMEAKLTEVMTFPLDDGKNNVITRKARRDLISYLKGCDAVAIGPGCGRKKDTFSLVRDLVKKIDGHVVLDADGINAFEGKLELLKKRKCSLVITPHPGEMAGLIKKDVSFIQMQRVDIARKTASEIKAVVCLKGHKTVVADPYGQVYVNETGNSGMATGGTGDVLTGIITSFIGQGVDEYSAAVSAVYLHGLAGDIACESKGPFSLVASDILEFLPQAFKKAGLY